jgi:hypothetical protein
MIHEKVYLIRLLPLNAVAQLHLKPSQSRACANLKIRKIMLGADDLITSVYPIY